MLAKMTLLTTVAAATTKLFHSHFTEYWLELKKYR